MDVDAKELGQHFNDDDQKAVVHRILFSFFVAVAVDIANRTNNTSYTNCN